MRAAASNVGQTITFDGLDDGTIVTTQYQSYGVVFSGDGDHAPLVANDGAASTNPVLSGNPSFGDDVAATIVDPTTGRPSTSYGLALDVGYIDNPGSVEIVGYDSAGKVLSSTQANAEGFNHIALHIRGLASFLIHSISDETAGWGIDNVAVLAAPIGTKVTRIASVGDSYSSGEGLLKTNTLQYDCGTDLPDGSYYQDTTQPAYTTWYTGLACDTKTKSTSPTSGYSSRPIKEYENECHRSGAAYPNAIRAAMGLVAADSLFVACSGATTKNIASGLPGHAQFAGTSPADVAGGNTQYTDLQNYIAAKGTPDLITVGVGGNDAHFADTVKSCIVRYGSCSDDINFTTAALSRIQDEVYPDLVTTFESLRKTGATIAAFGYLSPVVPGASCSGPRD